MACCTFDRFERCTHGQPNIACILHPCILPTDWRGCELDAGCRGGRVSRIYLDVRIRRTTGRGTQERVQCAKCEVQRTHTHTIYYMYAYDALFTCEQRRKLYNYNKRIPPQIVYRSMRGRYVVCVYVCMLCTNLLIVHREVEIHSVLHASATRRLFLIAIHYEM